MEINFTSDASKYISELLKPDEILVLFYDTEGCGCAMNGVPVLNIEAGTMQNELVSIKTNEFRLFMFKKHTIFFDEQMRIHFENNRLKLSSNNQIFSSSLLLRRREDL
ncbi:iron-sulfur cluster biosynthesis family protein [Anaerobacillus sp. CMMVII]|uniref:iron-sulfur cluster biosynthesis family protein n=1 Tax=Anaerobacillus sp. CMMVII TaxID=2755588 RepID=UPI0021B7EA5B|nr:iron-sulfur cluster biosynthesis family protein [Anaerobacillus sp. CMMVII]MCT8139719.1 iron-sulfur cluster biosynthesis family protein [Anaerobacillus sp. CMMVII]